MSSMTRILGGDVQVHHLRRDEQMIEPSLLAKHGRTARTLVKAGSFRLTLMALGPRGDLPMHSTDGPVSIQVLAGDVEFTVLGQPYQLAIGELIVLAPGVEHAARSIGGCTLLLTVVHNDTGGPSPVD
jgi:quercetin dioxygenase-like cupin family protein